MKYDVSNMKTEAAQAELTWIAPALQELLEDDEFSALRKTLAIYAEVLTERAM